MAKSIALSHSMDTFVVTDGTTATEFSLSGNGVRVEIEEGALEISSASNLPETSESDSYTTVDAQYTVAFNEANEVLEVIGIEDINDHKIINGGAYELTNGAAFNVRLSGNNLIISEY